jgi:hypothetical protein
MICEEERTQIVMFRGKNDLRRVHPICQMFKGHIMRDKKMF